MATLLSLLVTLLPAPAQAGAQQGKPAPSASELWRDYPLHTTPEARVRPTAQATSEVRENGSSPSPEATAIVAGGREDDGGAGGAAPVIIGMIVLIAVIVAWLAWVRAAPRDDGVAGLGAPASDDMPGSAPEGQDGPQRAGAPEFAAAPEHSGPAPLERHAAPPPAAPPDTVRAWNAEIEWHEEHGGPRFVLVAGAEGVSEPVRVTESESLDWPPKGSEALQALKEAVVRLEAAALEAGWTPEPAGRGWYAKRFAWKPVTGPVPTGRFRSGAPWPEGTETLYRGEIVWTADPRGGAFQAMAFGPGRPLGWAACSSEPFQTGAPDEVGPESEEMGSQVELMAAKMRAAGWEPAGRGAAWFSHRFLWREDDSPPERVERPTITDTRSAPR